MLFATAVSDLSIADALAEPRYRRLFVRLAEEMLAEAPVAPKAFDGFDPAGLDGSIERLVEFNRRSAKAHSGIYRDLAVRRRKTEAEAMLSLSDGPNIRRTLTLHPGDRGRAAAMREAEPRASRCLRPAGD